MITYLKDVESLTYVQHLERKLEQTVTRIYSQYIWRK